MAQASDARDEVRRLKNEIQGLYAQIEKDRQTNQEILKVLLKRTGTTMNGLDKAVALLDRSHGRIQKLQVHSIWVRLTDWFTPVVVLIMWGILCLAIGMRFSEYLYPRSVKLSGRELMQWNLARLIKCQKDNNPKCTFWIVPPEQRK